MKIRPKRKKICIYEVFGKIVGDLTSPAFGKNKSSSMEVEKWKNAKQTQKNGRKKKTQKPFSSFFETIFVQFTLCKSNIGRE